MAVAGGILILLAGAGILLPGRLLSEKRLGRMLAASLSERIGGEVSISAARLAPLGALEMDHISVVSPRSAPSVRRFEAGRAVITYRMADLLSSREAVALVLDDVYLAVAQAPAPADGPGPEPAAAPGTSPRLLFQRVLARNMTVEARKPWGTLRADLDAYIDLFQAPGGDVSGKGRAAVRELEFDLGSRSLRSGRGTAVMTMDGEDLMVHRIRIPLGGGTLTGRVDITTRGRAAGYRSSIAVKGIDLEEVTGDLTAPRVTATGILDGWMSLSGRPGGLQELDGRMRTRPGGGRIRVRDSAEAAPYLGPVSSMVEVEAALAALKDFVYDEGEVLFSIEEDAVSMFLDFSGPLGRISPQFVLHGIFPVLASGEGGTR